MPTKFILPCLMASSPKAGIEPACARHRYGDGLLDGGSHVQENPFSVAAHIQLPQIETLRRLRIEDSLREEQFEVAAVARDPYLEKVRTCCSR